MVINRMVTLLTIVFISESAGFLSFNVNPAAMKRTPDFIKEKGYKLETHETITEDGYILVIHRIPYGENGDNTSKRPVVVLQHGLMCSSDIWFLLGNMSLPFLLADEGYDVWVTNTRGNTYANKHVNLTADNDAYWNFSIHEQGIYDLPASIDYILKRTEQTKLIMIAHSLGCMVNMVLLSMRPEYNDKISLFIGYGAGVYMQNSKSASVIFLKKTKPVFKTLADLTDFTNTPIINNSSRRLRDLFCGEYSATLSICYYLSALLNGPTPLMTHKTAELLFTHYPDALPTKAVLHLTQSAVTGEFTLYDEGKYENLRKYGRADPPNYPLGKIRAPVIIFKAYDDYLVQPEDFYKFKRQLPNIKSVIDVDNKLFGHIGFVVTEEAYKLVYLKTIDILNNMTPFN